jgi:hypothetical protein
VGAAAEDQDAIDGDGERAQALDDVAHRERRGLEDGAGEVAGAMAGDQADEGAARVRVPLRRHRARERGQEGEAIAARRD